MTVLGYGQGCAQGMFRGATHPEMGHQGRVPCTHLDFLNCSSHEPGLLKYFVLHQGHIYVPLRSPVRSLWGAQDSRAGPSTAKAWQGRALQDLF